MNLRAGYGNGIIRVQKRRGSGEQLKVTQWHTQWGYFPQLCISLGFGNVNVWGFSLCLSLRLGFDGVWYLGFTRDICSVFACLVNLHL
jgi:hypothetical protein